VKPVEIVLAHVAEFSGRAHVGFERQLSCLWDCDPADEAELAPARVLRAVHPLDDDEGLFAFWD
jgi:hypothetical protein